jgi:uncharacterized protein
MRARLHLWMAGLGLAMGIALSAGGFTDWAEVHRMFTLGLQDGGPSCDTLRLMLAFCLAALLAGLGFLLLARRDAIPMKPIHRGTVPGAALFGAGWAITGACPAAALVQLGEGKLAALATLAGILAGSWLHHLARRRFGWRRQSCVD